MKTTVNCYYCGEEFLKFSYEVKRSNKHFCNRECFLKYKQSARVNLNCAYCGEEITKTPSEIKNSRSGLHFCDRLCKENAQKEGMHGVTPQHYHTSGNNCEDCGAQISDRSTKCVNCYKQNRSIAARSKIEIFNNAKNWTAARSVISRHARKVYEKSGKDASCKICGYSFYTEVCHIRNVCDFSDDTLVGEINNIGNLVSLCPNHHVEFDKGLIKI